MGNLYQYNEANFNRINDIGYTTFEGFAQDSWKVNKRLTVELGLRLTHFTPWADNEGFGYSVFKPSLYSPSCTPTQYCGFVWHSKDSTVPIGGFPTRALFFQPRLGLAYDLFGQGKTVLRGGWGRYYYHSGQFTNGLDVAAGSVNVTLNNNQGIKQPSGISPLLASQISSINPGAVAGNPAAVDSTDDKQPYTDSYSVTISERTPFSSLLEVAYVGNRSRDLANSSGAGSNINMVPIGAMLSSNNGGVDPNTLTANNFRPLKGFSDLYLATNNAYSNYNALQVTWVRNKGRYMVNLNYTYGRAMGIVNPALNQFDLSQNYGVLSSNRPQIFNAAYSVELGNPSKNKALGYLVNGWQFSGITQLQSGVNLTGQSGQAFGMALNGAKIPGTTFNISNISLLGTPNIQLNPILTCNPASGLKTNQYINPSCFTFPTQVGQNGGNVLPPIYGPAFFNSDLGLFKNFQNEKGSMKLQFRLNAYNFLNHPLWSFNGSNLSLGFNANGTLSTPNFGTVTSKEGHRVVQDVVNFFF
jgi:hypothetical protein